MIPHVNKHISLIYMRILAKMISSVCESLYDFNQRIISYDYWRRKEGMVS